MLEILSENRDLQTHIKKAEDMLTQVEISKLPSYQLGMEKGREKGREEGREQGREEGSMQTRLELARSLLDILDDETIAERVGLSLEIVQKLRSCFKNYCAWHSGVARRLKILMYSHVHSGFSPPCALLCRRS